MTPRQQFENETKEYAYFEHCGKFNPNYVEWLEQRQVTASPVNAFVSGMEFQGPGDNLKLAVPECEKCAVLDNTYAPQLHGNYICSSCGYEFKIPSH